MTAPRAIEMETLRDCVERGDNVTILDVRPLSERDEWSIPGSIHWDAYRALVAGERTALAGLSLPPDAPVITVCSLGRTSLIAAALLAEQGHEVYSLTGGMKAWSLAWNTAEVTSRTASLVQVRRTGKGCLSYLIGSEGEAIVVDASLAPEIYLRLAEARGWVIRHVLDTHIHADHLSRSRILAERSGAVLWLPDQERARFPHRVLHDGADLGFGSARLRAIATPGHTMESACYQIDNDWLLTGDTFFPDAVGRPDLAASSDQARARALLLHGSLRHLFGMDPRLLALPCHTSRPIEFDGRLIGALLGDAREAIALPAQADSFVDWVLCRIPPTPPNHHAIVALNEGEAFPAGDPTDLEAGANRCAVA